VKVGSDNLPDLGFDMTFGLDDNIYQRPVIIVGLRKKLGRDATLVELAPFFNLVFEHVEEVVLLNAADDLLFVVEAQVGRDRPRQSNGCFRRRNTSLFGSSFANSHVFVKIWNQLLELLTSERVACERAS
jgi:hypothetical protein